MEDFFIALALFGGFALLFFWAVWWDSETNSRDDNDNEFYY